VYAPEIIVQHPNTLRRWFESSERNIGILTGRISGLVVLDIDSEEGERNVRSRGIPEDGPQVLTGKGRHVYFVYPFERVNGGRGLKNFVGTIQGVDFRGDGGYVAAPPSLHESGREYQWVEDSFRLTLPSLPDWLFELAYRSGGERKANSTSADVPKSSNIPALGNVPSVATSSIAEPEQTPPQAEPQTQIVPPERVMSMLSTFEPENSSRPEFIAGLFRKGYPSILVAEPGLGKTILVQRLICDLSIGGPVWGGFSSSSPKNILMFCGEAGLTMLNERLESSGWNFNRERIKILDSRTAWKGGLYPALDTDGGQEVFGRFIEIVKPDLVVIDSLGSFAEDESGREAMKSVFDFLLSTGDIYGCAHLLVHHLRKRKNNERKLPLDMSEVIGSSVITRHSALVIGMEKCSKRDSASTSESRNEIIVRSLKTWDKPFPPFSFMIDSEEVDGAERLSIRFNLNPATGDDKQTRVWHIIREKFGDGRSFCKSDIELHCEGISSGYIKKLLTEWTELNRIEKFGSNRDTRYRLAASLREREPGTEALPG
jgi:hypothetical protein